MKLYSKLKINLAFNNSYNIFLENNLILWNKLKETKLLNFDSYFLIVDNTIPKSLINAFLKDNKDFFPIGVNDLKIIYIKGGESNKSFKNLDNYLNQLIKNKISRNSCIINLGGGVVGDLGGFLAATILRGVSFIQFPTTLLSIVDSSVGGKVGVNLKYGKNMVGAFHQPKLVYVNINFLETLDDKEWICGLAEIIKHSLLTKSSKLLNYLKLVIKEAKKENITPLNFLKKDKVLLKKILYEAILVKAKVVQKDEKEMGLRSVLNFGHTTAHALEDLGSYKKFKHGEAVSRGLITALFISENKFNLKQSLTEEIINIMQAFNLPCDTLGYKAENIFARMSFDKKGTTNGLPNYVLLSKKGKAYWKQKVNFEEFKKAWLKQKSRFG